MAEGSSGDAILAGTDGVIRYWPPVLERVVGYAAEEAVGRRVDLVVPHALRGLHWRGFNKAMSTGRIKRDGKPFSTVGLHKSGRPVSLRVLLEFTRDTDGVVDGVKALYLGPGPRALAWLSYPVIRFGKALSNHDVRVPYGPDQLS